MKEFVQLLISYDPSLVTPDFLADHVLECEGVESVEVDEEVSA